MEKENCSLTIYIDGASKGNPGKAAVGVAIYNDEGKLIKEISQGIGIATNNIAEYAALIFALQEGLILGCEQLTVYTDSELLFKQVKGEYKIKNDNLRILFYLVKHLIAGYKKLHIEHINRESNKTADKLASKAVE
ncbi:MAG: ribonuclease HI family protein [Candidatus Ratteibacteria bacterium]|nr:ribonuclease HI family protein [Candidatus Ratteibacteria bacterium]